MIPIVVFLLVLVATLGYLVLGVSIFEIEDARDREKARLYYIAFGTLYFGFIMFCATKALS